jgi:enterochelin esterase-like enzyme
MKMKIMILAALFCGRLTSQIQRPVAPPRVNPDLSVTYFVDVDATDVRLFDEVFSTAPPGLSFTRGPDGIWSLTTPPYEAGTHYYALVIDGVPTSAVTFATWQDRLPAGYYPFDPIEVHGPDPQPYDLRRVPHGVVHAHTLRSEQLQREVECYVYTPPGYEGSAKRYPVLYLMHTSDNASYWTRYGLVHRIMDNLIADSEAKEMILVMTQTVGGQAPALIERHMLEEIIPFAERAYRIDPDQASRYIAGNSAGAMHARNLGFLHPELFSAVGIMSGGGLGANAVPLELTYPKLTDASAFNAQVRFIYIAVGERDRVAIPANVQKLKDSLDRLGIPSTFKITTDEHSWFNWRRYFTDFIKRLSALP